MHRKTGIAQQDVSYPSDFPGLPEPLLLPWRLKPPGSARHGVEQLEDGRVRYWIVHQTLRNVSPAMLAWWFSHLEGDVEIGGRRYDRYRVWHPYDHVHVSYARRLPGGSVGPGAVLRIREFLGRNRRFLVNVTSDIEKLDEEGFIHNPIVHGVRGLARMEYRFDPVAGGTRYENCLILGTHRPWFRLLRALLQRVFFPLEQGHSWLRHNVEEVGMLENFLPALYRRETSGEA